ncbi:MAG: preprotein translocase subunit SecG [Clostridiales bacterium]|nr:preprotein translocase subunit SecG [Clostridiales bacterium]
MSLMLLFALSAGVKLAIRITLMALMLISAVYLIVVVMMQDDNSEGLGAIGGQTNDNESFYGKNTAKRKERIRKILTIVAACLLAVCAVLFYIFA